MDGVLIDSARPHWRSWQLLAEELGHELREDAFVETFGRQNRDIVPLFFGHHDDDSIRRLGDRKEELYRELVRDRIPVMDGAIELVVACREAGFALGVGSSGPQENIDLALRGMHIEQHFAAVITARQVTRGKPDPQVFSLAASGIDVPTCRCAIVEDAPAGVDAALAAGATAIGLTGTHTREALSAAHHVVESLRDLSPQSIRELIECRCVA